MAPGARKGRSGARRGGWVMAAMAAALFPIHGFN